MAVLTLPGVKRFWKNVKEYIDSRILASQNTFPTKVSDLQNDAGYYNQSTLPAINNGILTIQKNGKNVSTFSANQSSNTTANIQVPTKVSELTNDSGYLTEHQDLSDFATKQDISNLIDSAPTTLDTLKELADAIGNDPDFASTIATQIASKADDSNTVHKSGTETIPGEKEFVLPIKGSVTGNAGTANEFKSEKYIVLSGDVTGSAFSKGNWTVTTTLAPSGVSEGVYGQLTDVLNTKSLDIKIPEITVDSKGRITNIENHVVNCEIPDNGDVIIDGYVTGSGSFDKDGNCHITVTPNISDTPSVWYVGKTNAADKWGDDENGNTVQLSELENPGRLYGQERGNRIDLRTLPVTIGKAQSYADIILGDPSISRVHARIYKGKDGGIEIRDLDSTNGTWINGVRLKPNEKKIVHRGDEVRFGNVEYEYR